MKLLHGVKNKVNQYQKILNEHTPVYHQKWQVKIHSTYKTPKWIGLKMQTYTSGSKTGGRRQNSYSTQYSHISGIRRSKLKFVSLWAGKEARTYLSMVDQDKKDSLKTMLDTLED